MKKIGLFMVGAFALFGFVASANAAPSLSLSCQKEELKIGETTNCTVNLTTDVKANYITVEMSPSEYLDISAVTANAAAGWTADSAGTDKAKYKFSFESSLGVTGSKELFSFNLTLKETVRGKLSEGDVCGNLCLSKFELNKSGSSIPVEGGVRGTCYGPALVIENEPANPENPKTGEFMNYAIIAGVGVIAVAGVIIARKSTKFYRM